MNRKTKADFLLQLILIGIISVSSNIAAKASSGWTEDSTFNLHQTKQQTKSEIKELLSEASKPEYTIRTIYFYGTTYSKPSSLVRETPLQEGEVFTTAKLNKTLAYWRGLKIFRRVRIIGVELDRKNKIIDLHVEAIEKPGKTQMKIEKTANKSLERRRYQLLSSCETCF